MAEPSSRQTAEGGRGQPPQEATTDVAFQITLSRQFESWLAEQRINIAFTTYQAGRLFFLGLNPQGRLSVFNRTLERCMGLAYADNALYVSSLYQIYKFVDVARESAASGGYNSLFVPQLSSFTGDVDVHDMAVGQSGRLFFANTLFSCIAELSDTHSFKPYWLPPFIDRLAAEDRCHLNGVALEAGLPRYATAVAATNVADGWRDHRVDGGVLLDVKRNAVLLTGLSMPHSPRLYGGRIWLHDSGSGHFGYADLEGRSFMAVAFCPGYLRGLAFARDFAVVGLSKPRDNKTFSGLPLDDNLARHKVDARCGIYVIDLKSGDIVHWARIDGLITELYDVAVLPERRSTAAVGFKSDEIRRVISIET